MLKKFKLNLSIEETEKTLRQNGFIFKSDVSHLEEYYDTEDRTLEQRNIEICIVEQEILHVNDRPITYLLRLSENCELKQSMFIGSKMTDFLVALNYFPGIVLQKRILTYKNTDRVVVSLVSYPYIGNHIVLYTKDESESEIMIDKLGLRGLPEIEKTDKQLAEEYCVKNNKTMLVWE